MGWGLRTLEAVPEGTLVIEYIGEVLNQEQMEVSSILNGKYLYM